MVDIVERLKQIAWSYKATGNKECDEYTDCTDAAAEIERLRAQVEHMSKRDHENIMASVALGKWMAAALDDPQVCEEMKADIRRWFGAGEPVAAENLSVEIVSLRAQLAEARDATLDEVIKLIDNHLTAERRWQLHAQSVARFEVDDLFACVRALKAPRT
jgi:hypothetical protein